MIYPAKDDKGVMYPITAIGSAFAVGKELGASEVKAQIADYLKYQSGLSADVVDNLIMALRGDL